MSAFDRPIVCLDFDGVCHRYTSPWRGPAHIPDPPVEGLFAFLGKAVEAFAVHIFSARSHQDGGIEAMREWFRHWAEIELGPTAGPALVAQLSFPTEKPPFWVGLDDRVWCFRGIFPTIEAMREFLPWNKGGCRGVVDPGTIPVPDPGPDAIPAVFALTVDEAYGLPRLNLQFGVGSPHLSFLVPPSLLGVIRDWLDEHYPLPAPPVPLLKPLCPGVIAPKLSGLDPVTFEETLRMLRAGPHDDGLSDERGD